MHECWKLDTSCVDLMDQIRIKIMEKMNQKRKLAAKWKGVLWKINMSES